MKQGLKGYDGAIDGMKILHGFAVVAPQEKVALAAEGRQPGSVPDIEPVMERAIEVIGDREAAMRWLGTPVRALNYATPISLLRDLEGHEQVLAVLTQLEHGVL